MLLKRAYNPVAGKLTGVGGHIENNETSKECAHRELIEEAGFDTELIPIANIRSISSRLYLGALKEFPFEIKIFNEGTIKWYTKEEALNDNNITKETRAILNLFWGGQENE